MLVNIGEGRSFYIETDNINTIDDYGNRHGCEITMKSGQRIQSDNSAATVVRKIEAAKKAAQ
jgi:hypothetical protein